MRLQPYTLQPAKGKSFYNRETLFQRIMQRSQEARHTHLLGMRGAGKTSILLKIAESQPSLYFTFQAMGGKMRQFQGQTRLQLMRQQRQYAWLPKMARQDDPFEAIGEAAILAEQEGQVLFLLFDEVEGLQRFEADFLQQVGYLLSGALSLCVVLASAKNISNLNEKVIETGNSPLPFPSPDYLTPFEDEPASALICQSSSDEPLKVPVRTMKAIKYHTNNQPQLIQWLCFRLWLRNQDSGRWQITDELFHVPKDDQLAHRFLSDFKYLSPQERRILWAVLHKEPVPTNIPSNRRTRFMSGLSKLGYLRHVDGRYQIGNTFLLRWFEENKERLDWEDRTQQPSDEGTLGMYEEEPPEEVTLISPKRPGGRRLSKENDFLYQQILDLISNNQGATRGWKDIYNLILKEYSYFKEWKAIRGSRETDQREAFRKALKRMIDKAKQELKECSFFDS